MAGCISRDQPRPYSKEAEPQRSPVLEFPILMPRPVDVKALNLVWWDEWEGACFSGQPRHCICKNVVDITVAAKHLDNFVRNDIKKLCSASRVLKSLIAK